MTTDNTEDDLFMAHMELSVLPVAFDILDTTLFHAIETLKSRRADLAYDRESPATAISIYRLYLNLDNDGDERAIYLGLIELRKMQAEVTEASIRRMATGEQGALFNDVVTHWKAFIEFNKDASKNASKKRQIRF